MKFQNHLSIILAVIFICLFGLAACGGGGGGSHHSTQPSDPGNGTDNPATPNTTPVADAGRDQNVKVGDMVTLDASNSTDPGGDVLTYTWAIVVKPEGSAAALDDETSAAPSFTADVDGVYQVGLVVQDADLASEPDVVTITAERGNSAPVSNAGSDQSVKTGSVVTLDGSASTDADGDTITYQWNLDTVPDGSTASLDSATSVNPSFTPDMDGEYVVGLVVNDGQVASDGDSVTVTAATPNSAPVADAGPDQDVLEGTTVRLDGSGSSDADGDFLLYSWLLISRPSGSSAELDKGKTVSPTFVADVEGTFVVELLVGDGEVDSETDRVSVTVTKANVKPVADAGGDQSVVEDTLVTLNGSNSSDPDGDALTYQWRAVSVPIGGSGALSDTSAPAPTFTPEAVGSYVFALVVNDGELDSDEDRVTVTVSEANAAPVADAGRDANAMTGAAVTLDGSNSSDANGDTLSYQWAFISKPSGSSASLANASTDYVSFTADVDGTYVLELTVSDGDLEDRDRVTVTAKTANSAPVADAGRDQAAYVGETVALDGSGSSDADGDTLSYAWSFVAKPVGSSVSIRDTNSAIASFAPDMAGDYIVRLDVEDGETAGVEDTVRIEVLVPDLKLEMYDEGDIFDPPMWRSVGLPFNANSTINQNCSGCRTVELAKFRMKAVGGDYTLRNVEITNLNTGGSFPSGLNPRYEGLQHTTDVNKGDEITYRLLVDYVPVNVQVEFFFEVEETGEVFRSRYTLNFR